MHDPFLRFRFALIGCACALLMVACGDRDGAPAQTGWALAPGTDIDVEITGRDFLWHYRYAGPDAQLGTADDVLANGDLHLPAGVNARIYLKSDDYIYTLAVPHLGLHAAAVPQLTIEKDFNTKAAGVYELLGDQMCGYQHEDLIVKFVVEPGEQFLAWAQTVEETQP